MKKFIIKHNNLADDIKDGIAMLALRLGISLVQESSSTDIELEFNSTSSGLHICRQKGKVRIGYTRPNDAFRALANIVSAKAQLTENYELCEARAVENVYVMLDVSRNAVIKPEKLEDWLCFMALSGINGLMLYTEDTYELPGHDYFGYMRGGYTQNELKKLDEIAEKLDIEIVPCIQTMGHLNRILCYPCYGNIAENKSVLLPDSDDTLKFIGEMVSAASRPFRSSKIHIGMDEAWGIGRGASLSQRGYRPPFEIMTEYLQNVISITNKLELEPMMWSDMFFRGLSPTGMHYDPDIKWPPEVLSKIPPAVKQIYWNYYHSEAADYSHFVKLHKAMCQSPAVATGIQTWGRFWPAYEHSKHTLEACFKSCRENGVKDLIITLWGDDGTECDYSTALPLLFYAGELNFTGQVNNLVLENKTRFLTGTDYSTWQIPAELDMCDFSAKSGRASNWSKALLWDDPLLGLWTAQLKGHRMNKHYSKLVEKLKAVQASKHDSLRFPLALAEVLELKADLPVLFREAYSAKDHKKLAELQLICSSKIIPRLRNLNHIHRQIWHKNCRAFGWEVLERRYGGIITRMENISERIESYVSGEVTSLEELESTPLAKFNMNVSDAYLNSCAAVYSSGQIFHTMDE